MWNAVPVFPEEMVDLSLMAFTASFDTKVKTCLSVCLTKMSEADYLLNEWYKNSIEVNFKN